MATSRTASLDHEIAEQIADLSPSQKRELLDFATFLTSRRGASKRPSGASLSDFTAIIDIAGGGQGETDLSINHDKYLYGEDAP